MKDYLAVGQDPNTKLYHGLFYVNHPTPSGCNRPILKSSTTKGYESEKEALDFIKKAFTVEQLNEMDIPKLED